jgi:uncharacterized protein YeaO (DUF488 family)
VTLRRLRMARPAVIRVARVYDAPTREDGARVLVDRLWPRGLTKARAALDEWCKEVAPSTELRKWYGHDPARFDEFTRRYRLELEHPDRSGPLGRLRELAKEGTVTLLTASKEPGISEADVIAEILRH